MGTVMPKKKIDNRTRINQFDDFDLEVACDYIHEQGLATPVNFDDTRSLVRLVYTNPQQHNILRKRLPHFANAPIYLMTAKGTSTKMPGYDHLYHKDSIKALAKFLHLTFSKVSRSAWINEDRWDKYKTFKTHIEGKMQTFLTGSDK